MTFARVKEVFLEVVAHPPNERSGMILKACAGDAALRTQVERLLKNHEQGGKFLGPLTPDGETVGIRNRIEPAELPGGVIGRYKLLQQIGEGGFGVVYMADQEHPVRRKVALKIIKLGMDTRQVIARFEAERQALAMMDHPNIAKVLDAGATETGRPYFVMELVKGVPITQFCDAEELPLPSRLRLFLNVCSAVQHAHQKGIIHRDIKPGNILVTLHDGEPVPKVIDFGIAKAIEHKLTERTMFTEYGQFIGTPAYMSPEQAEMSGLDVDTRSDIYSLGVLLYELLTSSLPFDPQRLLSAGHVEMARIIREEEPRRPSTRLRTLGVEGNGKARGTPPTVPTPTDRGDMVRRSSSVFAVARMRRIDAQSLVRTLRGDLDWIVMKCLEKDRTRRYESAGGLAKDVARFLVGETVSAAPPSTAYRVRKFVKRNRAVVTTATVVAAGLVLGLATATAGFVQARKQRNAAQSAYAAEQEQRRVAIGERDRARDYAEKLRHELYAATIEKIQRIIATDGVEPVKPLLEQCDPELRGWEWDRLHFLADRSETTIPAADGAVRAVQFAEDGSVFLAAWESGIARVWDAQSLEVLVETREPGRAPLFAASLSRDGGVFATGHGGKVHLWNARTGRLLREIALPRPTLHDVALNRDGSLAALGYWHGGTQIYDALAGKLVLDLEGDTTSGRRLVFSNDGSRLMVGAMGNDVSVFNVADGRALWRQRAAIFIMLNAAFSPDEKLVATVGLDAQLWLRRADTGELVYTVATGKGASGALAFHPDGEVIAVGGIDGLISIFRTATGEKLYSLHGHEAEITSVAFDPSGRFLISGARDGTVKRWHMGCASPQVTLRHVHIITGLHYSADGTLLWASGGAAKDVQAIRVAELERIPLDCPIHALRSVAISPDGERLALSGYLEDNTYETVVTDDRLNVLRRLDPSNEAYTAMSFSPDGRWLVAGAATGPLRLHDTASGATAWDFGGRDDVMVPNNVLFSRDGELILNGSREGTIRLFVPESGALLREFSVAQGAVGPVALDSAGDRLFSGNGSNIEIWDWRTPRHLATMTGHTGPVTALAVMPGDRRLVSGGADATIRLWDVTSARQVMLVGRHDGIVRAVAVSHDGATIATGGEDNSVRLWETRAATPAALDARYERLRGSWTGYATSP